MFDIRILTPQKSIFEGKAKYLKINTPDGQQVILDSHEPFLSQILTGELLYLTNNELHPYAVSSGFIEISGNSVNVLVNNAIHSKDIDIQKAIEAKRRAEEIIKEIDNNVDIMKLKAQIKLANL